MNFLCFNKILVVKLYSLKNYKKWYGKKNKRKWRLHCTLEMNIYFVLRYILWIFNDFMNVLIKLLTNPDWWDNNTVCHFVYKQKWRRRKRWEGNHSASGVFKPTDIRNPECVKQHTIRLKWNERQRHNDINVSRWTNMWTLQPGFHCLLWHRISLLH